MKIAELYILLGIVKQIDLTYFAISDALSVFPCNCKTVWTD